MSPLLEIRDLSVRFGPVAAVQGVSLDVEAGRVVGLIGPNGAGKTTLLDAVTGFLPVAGGQVVFAGSRIDGLPPHQRARLGLARTFQSLELFEDLTVGENLAVAAEVRPGRASPGRAPAVGDRGGVARPDETRARPAARTGGLADSVGGPLELLGLEGVADRLPAELSHGQRKSVALARALASAPRLLLLDEPAAGLDAAARDLLAARLRELAGEGVTIVLVDHDMSLVGQLCDEVCVLDVGRLLARGSPEAVRRDPAVVAAYLGTDEDATAPPSAGRQPPGPDGAPPVRARGLRGGYGPVAVVHDVDLDVGAGEVVALLGANGAGKTTTVLTLSGVLRPMAGEARVLGAPVVGDAHRVARRGLAHVPQDRAVLPGLTVAENLRLAARGSRPAAASALERLPALRPLAGRPAGHLSGGEQQLLACARALASRPRALLVDELSLGLGPALVRQLLALMRELADEGVAVLLVEQHAHIALQAADRAYVLERGRVAFSGSAAELASRRDLVEAAYLGYRPGSPGAAPSSPGSA